MRCRFYVSTCVCYVVISLVFLQDIVPPNAKRLHLQLAFGKYQIILARHHSDDVSFLQSIILAHGTLVEMPLILLIMYFGMTD